MIFIGFSEIGLSSAWFSDIFASLGIILFYSWLLYWHVLYVKERERTDLHYQLTSKFNRGYEKVIASKNALESGNLEQSRKLLEN